MFGTMHDPYNPPAPAEWSSSTLHTAFIVLGKHRVRVDLIESYTTDAAGMLTVTTEGGREYVADIDVDEFEAVMRKANSP